MSNVTFTISNNKNCRFTSTQVEKVNQAIQILDKVWNSPAFKKAICNNNWMAENGTTYNRFHMSNGMSNDQVWSCIWNACNTPTNTTTTKTVVNVVPCATWSDYNWCVNNDTPCVCVNVNYVNCEWYTPVHIASSMMYDFCVNCCGFSWTTSTNMVQCWNNTVPAACSTIVRDCAQTVCKDMVSQWSNHIDNTVYNCYPCCTTWSVDEPCVSSTNSCVKVNEAICAMQYEIDCLSNISKKTDDEVNRMTMLTNAVETMNAMCNNMFVTSLDGCESAWMPTVATKNVVTG